MRSPRRWPTSPPPAPTGRPARSCTSTAAEPVGDPAADRAPDDPLQLVRVVDAIAYRDVERLLQLRSHLVEDGLVLSEAAGMDLGAAGDLAGHRVDDDDHRDESLVAEDPAVLELGLGDVADRRAVDEDVAALDLAGDPCDAVDQVDDHTVLGDHDLLARHTGQAGQVGVGMQMAHLAVDR